VTPSERSALIAAGRDPEFCPHGELWNPADPCPDDHRRIP
jgi:hypothetical protein